MQVFPDDLVAIACYDDGRRGDLRIERRLLFQIGEQPFEIGGVVAEGAGPQHQRWAGPFDVIERARIGTEDIQRAALQPAEPQRHDDGVIEQPADDRRRRDMIIPVDAARPGMGGGCQKEQAGCLFGMAQAEGCGDRAAERMTDNDRPLDAACLHQPGDRVRLAGRHRIFGAAAFGIAVTGAIDEEHFGPALECGAEGDELVEQIAAGAVNEDESRQIGMFRTLDMDGIHAIAADIRQFTDIGIGLFESPCLVRGVADGGGEGSEKSGNFCKHDLYGRWLRRLSRRVGEAPHGSLENSKIVRSGRASRSGERHQVRLPASFSDSVLTCSCAVRSAG
ncbi:hypothetical protein RHECNPAF_770024 [Rhizobium etli CNPAF512]|nr:hypothetical protein RHECNPAF_770024 [Rhizobium etli CNPAF512]